MAIKILSRLEEYNNGLQHTDWGIRTCGGKFDSVLSIRSELKSVLKDSASMGALPALSLAEVYINFI